MSRLAALRLRLTLWYAGTLGLILLVLGAGLFLVIRSQIAHQLDVSLEGAARELMRAAAIREMEAASAHGLVVDALEELRIPDRTLFLLDAGGGPVKPAHVDSALLHAVTTMGHSPLRTSVELGREEARVYAERFTTPSGTAYMAVAVADERELEDEYAALIAAFAAAAFVALLLFAGGGYILVRQSTIPIERTVEYMRRFMADAAHELRTPITVLRTRAEATLQRKRKPEEYERALVTMAEESERMGRIVEDLLLLARADSGERQPERARVFLDVLVRDVAGGAGVVAERRGVRLNVDQGGEAEVQGDPMLLRQLISNLLDNAVKFTPPGGQVSIGVAADGGGARLTVEDTGPGITADQLPHIFERFFRGDPARSRADGAGLGLAIVRWIADAHGARIDVASDVGRGTRIGVRFPAPMASA